MDRKPRSNEVGPASKASASAGQTAAGQDPAVVRIGAHRPALWRLGLFFTAYVLGGGFAQSLAIIPGSGISIWPNSGLFLATLLVVRPQSWPWWVLAGCAAELVGNALWFKSTLPAALLIYGGNGLEAMTGALLLGRVLGRPVRLNTLRDVLVFVALGAGVAPIVSATVGATTIASFGMLSQTFTGAWQLLWIGDAAGVLIVAPLALAILTHWRDGAKLSAARWIEAALMVLVFAAVAVLSLGGLLPFAYIIMPPLLWAAVRFEFKGAAVALTALALVTAMFTINGASQFAGDPETQRERHIMLQLFLAVSAFSALIVAAISRQHQQALRTLEQREARIRRLVDSDVIGIVIWDLDGSLIDANDAFLRMVRYDRRDVASGLRWFDMTPPEWQEVHAREEAEELARTGMMRPREKEFFRKDGSRVPVLIGAATFEGQSNQGVAYILDVSERKRAEASLRDRERELSQLVDMVPSYLWRMDPDGAPAFFNLRFTDFLGFGVAAAEPGRLSTLIERAIHPDDAAEVAAAFERCLASGEPLSMKWRMRRADGAYRWMAASAEALRNQDGDIVQWYGLCHDIDDQIRTEQALRDRELELSQLVELSPVYISRMSPTGEPTWYSKRTLAALGIKDIGDWDEPGVTRLSAQLNTSLHPDDAKQMAETIRNALATGTPYTMRYRRRTPEGGYEWREGRADPVLDEKGQVTQWFCATLGVDAQVRTEIALREQQRELSQLVDMVPSYLWRMDPDGAPAFFNSRLAGFLGFDTDWVAKPRRLSALIETAIHREDATAAAEAFARCLATGEPLSMKWRMRRADGVYRWMTASAEALRNEEGDVVQWYGLCHDIDDQIRTEDALREREQELSLLIEMLPVHVVRATPTFEPTYYSKRTLTDIGMAQLGDWDEPDETRLSSMMRGTLHPDDVQPMADVIAHAIATGTPYSMRYRRRQLDGSYRWVEGRADPLRDENGAIVQWYAVSLDVDAQVRAEIALRENERKLQEIIDAVPVRIWSTDASGGPVYFNRRYQDHFRAAVPHFEDIPDPRLEALLQELVHPEDAAGAQATLSQCFQSGQSGVMRFRWREADGGYRWAECRVEPRRDEDGAIVQWYGASIDIEDEVRAQEALLLAQERVARASQAASLAELSASIAHEVNQPLAAVVANSHACQRWLTLTPPNIARAQTTVDRIIRDANAAGDVVSRIRALFKQSVDSRRAGTIERVIAEARRWLADTSLGAAASIEVRLDPDLPALPFDAVQIQQVLINLMRNALDAMDGAPGPRVVFVGARREGDVVRVEVRDTGPGIPDPERIFDPFFTTKESGMGMGLAISKSIVESHGGRLWAEPSLDGGATLAFTLPLAAEGRA